MAEAGTGKSMVTRLAKEVLQGQGHEEHPTQHPPWERSQIWVLFTRGEEKIWGCLNYS